MLRRGEVKRRGKVRTVLCLLMAATCAGPVWLAPRQESPLRTVWAAQMRPLDYVDFVRSSVVRSGPLKGAVRVAPGGRVNWYFANLGVRPFARALPAIVRAHLGAYLSQDVVPPDAYGQAYIRDYEADLVKAVPADSTDAYASTFLSLARAYVEASGDLAWFRANRAQVLRVAYHNLARRMKANGLISTFQTAAWGAAWNTAYTMDNAENYRGLDDLVWLLGRVGDRQSAAYYALVRDGVGRGLFDGVTGTWNAVGRAFFVSDRREPLRGRFYPDATAQVWPQLFAVTGGDPRQDAERFAAARAYLEQVAPHWEEHAYDAGHPWMALGAAYAQAGQADRAIRQRLWLRRSLAEKRLRLLIHEVGFDALIGRLSGRP